jgi:hypothetical protein
MNLSTTILRNKTKIWISLSLMISLMMESSQLYAQNFYKERSGRNQTFGAGIGPSLIFADNGGIYRELDFKLKPSFSLHYGKRMSSFWQLRATAGIQSLSSGGNYPIGVLQVWDVRNSAFRFSGTALYADVMPIIQLMPFFNHMDRTAFNFYGGIGVGFVQASTTLFYSMTLNNPSQKQRLLTASFPVRSGVNYRLGDYGDISLEGSLLLTLTDQIDGNTGYNKLGDHLINFQLQYTRYFKSK